MKQIFLPILTPKLKTDAIFSYKFRTVVLSEACIEWAVELKRS